MNKKAAFTYTFTVCRTEKNLFIKTGYWVEYKREEPVIAARCYGRSKGQQKIPADINRSMEDAAVMDSTAAYNRHTRRHRWLRNGAKKAQASVFR